MAEETAAATTATPPTDRPAALRVSLLGGFEVARGDAPVPRDAWRRRRPADLLKLLAATPSHAIARDEVISTLWPGKDPASGANNLHRALYDLRQILGGRFVDVEDGVVVLGPGVWVDVDAFEAGSRGDRDALRAAVALYRGDLCPEDRDAPWLAARRDALRRRFASAARPLAVEQAGREPAAAVPLLRRALEVEPGNEEAWRLLVRLLAETGRRADALRQYDACEAALRAESGRGPGAETRALVEAVIRGDVGPRAGPRTWDGWRRAVRRFCGAPDPTPLRGREAIRVLLESLLEQGHGMLVLLGEAGVGKTRLALEGARLAQERGAVVLAGAGGPAAGSILRSALADYDEAHGLPFPDPFREADREAGDGPEASRRRLFEAVPRLLRSLGGGRTVYLVAEDLHLADESSLNLLHLLARGAAGLPLVVVATCRDDEVLAETPVHMFLAHVDGERLARGVRLPRLHLEATRAILGDVLPSAPSDGFVSQVHRATDGNPFHVEQLARSFRELGRFEAGEGPAAVIRARVARLGRKAQSLLAAGSVLGTRIDYELLRALTGLSGHDLLQGIEPCLEARILAADGDTYRFRHSLLRDAVYESMAPERRRELHRAAADALEARAAATGTRERWLEALAFHRRAAEQHEEAVGPLLAIGQRALAGGGLAEGVRHLALALESAEAGGVEDALRFQILESLGRAQLALGDLGSAERSLAAAAGLPERSHWRPTGEQRARARRLQALACVAGGRTGAARALLEGLDPAADVGAERAEALRVLSAIAAHQGREADAAALAGRADDEAVRIGEGAEAEPGPFDLELALWEADLLWHRPAPVVEAAARAAADGARRRGDAGGAAVARAAEGACLLAQGRLVEAEEALREAADVLRARGLALPESFARERLGMALTEQGRVEEGLLAVGDGLLAAERATLRWHGLTRLHAALARNRLAAGALHAAEDALREASASAAHHGECWTCHAVLRPVSLEVALRGGRQEEAGSEARALEAMAAVIPSAGMAVLAAAARARVAAESGRLDEARTAAGRARAAARAAGVKEDPWIPMD